MGLDDEGNFVLAWDETPDFSDYSIVTRRFNAETNQLGDRVIANEYKNPFRFHWASFDKTGC